MPVRNAEETLDWALTSMLSQKFLDWELVAVNDDSRDNSLPIFEKRARFEEKMRIVPSQGGGIVAALNTGLSAAAGLWTVRVDADDACHPDLLPELFRSIRENPDVRVHSARVLYFPRLSMREGLSAYEGWVNGLTRHEEIVRDMFVECPVPHPTMTCRREELTAMGGYRDMGWPEDYDLVMRLWLSGARFAKVPRALYYWRDTKRRLSRTHPSYSHERFTAAKVAFLRQSYLSKKQEAVVSGAGPVGKAFARCLMENDVKVAAFLEVDPRKVGNVVYGVKVLPVEEATRFSGTMILHAVGKKGNREMARKLYCDLGLTELSDYIFVS